MPRTCGHLGKGASTDFRTGVGRPANAYASVSSSSSLLAIDTCYIFTWLAATTYVPPTMFADKEMGSFEIPSSSADVHSPRLYATRYQRRQLALPSWWGAATPTANVPKQTGFGWPGKPSKAHWPLKYSEGITLAWWCLPRQSSSVQLDFILQIFSRLWPNG